MTQGPITEAPANPGPPPVGFAGRRTVLRTIAPALALGLAVAAGRAPAAPHSFEFVAEHLPEAAMDNRYATLPLWREDPADAGGWRPTLQAGLTRVDSGGLSLRGPMASLALGRHLGDRWSITGFAFLDDLRFSGGDQRPLETLFTRTPLALPALAEFSALDGTYRNQGAGLAFGLSQNEGWLGAHAWRFGALYQRVALRGYRARYSVIDGASSGATGLVDYSAGYPFLTPFAGLVLPRRLGAWQLNPHALLAVPLPRRGVQGRITGPGFDLRGDTASVGQGKHVGDISLTLGLDLTYLPWGLSVDLGSLVTQPLIEPVIHKGIDRSWVLSVQKRF